MKTKAKNKEMIDTLLEETMKELVESTVFRMEELQDLKDTLNLLKLPEEQKKELIKSFLLYLTKIYEDLNDQLPFFFEHLVIRKELEEYSSDGKKSTSETLNDKLREREELLEKIGTRLYSLSQRLEASENSSF
ncbi:MAG: hypothetical protein GF311_25415 [Candidatus Lokiarchaeota archaeon]|nr:hypothetical protein [Candidatus Lokiarchaeota archaeon]